LYGAVLFESAELSLKPLSRFTKKSKKKFSAREGIPPPFPLYSVKAEISRWKTKRAKTFRAADFEQDAINAEDIRRLFMKNRIAIVAFAAVITLAIGLTGFAQRAKSGKDLEVKKLPVAQKIMLGCQNPGSHQDVAKTPTITNSTSQALAAGKKVYWSASDGDKGTISLSAALQPNKTVQAMGTAGNGYSCQAWTY
jgi:hypothetical protein